MSHDANYHHGLSNHACTADLKLPAADGPVAPGGNVLSTRALLRLVAKLSRCSLCGQFPTDQPGQVGSTESQR